MRTFTALRTVALCLICTVVGVGVGAGLGSAQATPAPGQAEPSSAPAEFSRYQKLDLFARALTIIEQHYVRPVDGEALTYAAIRGLVGELDPHSNFLDPDEARILREDMEGAFGGVGMVVVLARTDEGTRYLDIRDVVPGSPAQGAGIAAGHRIVKIEGRSIAQFADLQRTIASIRGRPGTTLRVTVEDPVRGVTRTVSLVRELIDPPAVERKTLGQGLEVLRLREFSDNAAREMRASIAQARKDAGADGLKGIIIDLRDNGGGLLSEAIDLVDLFVVSGPIVRTRGRLGTVIDEARAHRPGTEAHLPMVVLVNKASASASEIVAGALQDHARALIVGERTYGKGSVQAPFELDDGSLLKITTALYYTPNDRLILDRGIIPDVYVGSLAARVLPGADSRPEITAERGVPRHLDPADVGRKQASGATEAIAVTAAGDDAQLRVAVQHILAWDRFRPHRHLRRN